MDERRQLAQDMRAAWSAMLEDAVKHPAERDHIAEERARRLRLKADERACQTSTFANMDAQHMVERIREKDTLTLTSST